MKGEYLLFNISVIASLVCAKMLRSKTRVPPLMPALIAVAATAIPYAIGDQLVTGIFWYFNPQYILGIFVGRLPVEEFLFFLTVPYACLFLWVNIHSGKTPPRRTVHVAVIALVAIVAAFLSLYASWYYTAAVWGGVVLMTLLDIFLGTGVLNDSRYFRYSMIVTILTAVYNGYLTSRPIVLYNGLYKTPLILYTIPAEDFIYGLSMVTLTVISYCYARSGLFSPQSGRKDTDSFRA